MDSSEIKTALSGLADKVEAGSAKLVTHFSQAIRATNQKVEELDAKTDALIGHIVTSKRTLFWIAVIVLLDFLFGLYAGLKL